MHNVKNCYAVSWHVVTNEDNLNSLCAHTAHLDFLYSDLYYFQDPIPGWLGAAATLLPPPSWDTNTMQCFVVVCSEHTSVSVQVSVGFC